MAQTKDIKTDRYGTPDQAPPIMAQPAGSTAKVYGGTVAITRAGYVVAASSPQSTDKCWGIVSQQTDNSGGGNGDANVPIDRGTFWLAYGTSTDAFAQSDVGKLAYLIDEITVGKTNGSNTRPQCGDVMAVDTVLSKVAVRIDPTLG